LKKFEKVISELENQCQSAEIILLMSIHCYQLCKDKKNDLFKRIKENQDRNTTIIQKFEASIENLKKIELHDKLKTDK
jgi:hypothetical protein